MRTVSRFLAIGVLCTTLLGCLPDGDIGDKTERVELRRTAQAEGMARSLAVVGARVFSSFTSNSASPFVQAANSGGAISAIPTQPIDFRATYGLNLGPAGDLVSAGYCGDGSADARQSFIVWLNPSDGANRFAPSGLGDGATGNVMAQLTRMSDPGSVGVAEGGLLKMMDGNDMTLGSCSSFNIPVGAPVLVYAGLELPARMTSVTTRTETRTVACPAGQDGTITQTQTVTVAPNGAETENGWTTVNSLCSAAKSQLSQTSLSDGNADLMQDIAGMASGLAPNSDLGLALGSLGTNECKSTLITKVEIDPNTGENVRVTYDTCTGERSTVAGIEGLQAEPIGDPWYEPLTRACSASTVTLANPTLEMPMPFNATLIGSWSALPWGPNDGAKYQRKVQRYRVLQPSANANSAPVYNEVDLREPYTGVSLNCNRQESISFGVDLFEPDWASMGINPNNLTLLEGNGILYRRTAIVDGWADPVALSPKSPRYTEWTADVLDGRWEEKIYEGFTCDNGLPGERVKTRVHTLTGYKTVSTSTWVYPNNEDNCTPLCTQATETRAAACPAGQMGSVFEQRTVNQGGICGSNGAWSQTGSNCQPICTEAVEQRTSTPCPSGQFGTITEERTVNQCGVCGDNSPWTVVNNTCQPVTTNNGACGSATSTPVPTAPTSNLCSSTAAAVWTDQTGNDGTFNWTCPASGEPAGTSANCSVAKQTEWTSGACGETTHLYNPTCNPTQELVDITCPEGQRLQLRDIHDCPVGSGYALWKTEARCVADATCVSTENGACGASDGGEFAGAPTSGLCTSSANPTWQDQTGNDGEYNWTCPGSGTPVGTNDSCTATKPEGICVLTEQNIEPASHWINNCNQLGYDFSGSYVLRIPGGGRVVCQPDQLIEHMWCPGGGEVMWATQGVCNGSYPTCEPDTPPTTTENGACGTATSGTTGTAPTTNLCTSSGAVTWQDTTASDGTFNWTCTGSGSPVGTNASCQSAKTLPTCTWNYTGTQTCSYQRPEAAYDTDCTTMSGFPNGTSTQIDATCLHGAWADEGQPYGSCGPSQAFVRTYTCGAVSTFNGDCGSSDGGSGTTAPTSGLCDGGTLQWTDQTGTDGTFNWTCQGGGNPAGSNASCSYTKTPSNMCALCDSASDIQPHAWVSPSCNAPDQYVSGNMSCQDGGGHRGSCGIIECGTVIASGSCGTSNGGSFTSAPTTNLCAAGSLTWTDQTGTDGSFNWICNGSGGGASPSCAATKTTPPSGNLYIADGFESTGPITYTGGVFNRTGTIDAGNGNGNFNYEGLGCGFTVSITYNGETAEATASEVVGPSTCNPQTTVTLGGQTLSVTGLYSGRNQSTYNWSLSVTGSTPAAQCGGMVWGGNGGGAVYNPSCAVGTVQNYNNPQNGRETATWTCVSGGTNASCSEGSGIWKSDNTADGNMDCTQFDRWAVELGGPCWESGIEAGGASTNTPGACFIAYCD